MALIDCPQCSKPVSDLAAVCPHCGKLITAVSNDNSPKELTKWQLSLWKMLKISGILYILSLLLLLVPANLSYISKSVISTLITARIVIDFVGIYLAFFSIGMAVSNKALKPILIVMWVAMASYSICTFWEIHAVYPQLQIIYRVVKLLFLAILFSNLLKTSLALPIAIYIILSIFYIVQPIMPVNLYLYCSFWGDSVILTLFFAVYFMLISKTSWWKVFNRANNH